MFLLRSLHPLVFCLYFPRKTDGKHSNEPPKPPKDPQGPQERPTDTQRILPGPLEIPGGPAGNDRRFLTFLEFYNVLALQAPPRIPQGDPKDATKALQGRPGDPQGPPSTPKETQRTPNVPQRTPKERPRTPQGPPRSRQGPRRTPKTHPRSSEDPCFLKFNDPRSP